MAPCRHRVPDRCGGHHRVWQPVITCGWVDRRRSVVNPIRSGCPRPRIARRCSPPQAIGWVAVWTACEHGRTDIYAATSEDGAVQFGAPVRVNDVEGEAHVYGEDPPRVAIVPSAAQSQAVLPETVEAINGWQQYAANEYGFYANLNPAVDHPRWSQTIERRISEFFRRKTLMFNGYADQVQSLYAGMDLRRNY